MKLSTCIFMARVIVVTAALFGLYKYEVHALTWIFVLVLSSLVGGSVEGLIVHKEIKDENTTLV